MSLIELLVSVSLFSLIASVTFLLYQDGQAIMARSTARMDSRQVERDALGRMMPFLAGAYVPPITGVTNFYESPNPNWVAGAAAYPAGATASSFSSSGPPGTDSIIFFAAGDLLNGSVALSPVTSWTFGAYDPSAGPKLYEIRLDTTYLNDPLASYQPDQLAVPGGIAPLIQRPLVIRELYMPQALVPPFQYLVPPTAMSPSPSGSALPAPSTPTRVLSRKLSDVRFYLAPAGGGISVAVYGQDREGTTNKARGTFITTTSLNSVLYNLQGK
jgi:type II secretory pathway pseudopilin PulG